MSTIENAVALLRQSVNQETGRDHLKDTIDGVASCLVLLKSSRPSHQAIEKLRSVLREPFQPLYDAYQGQALQLASAVLTNILGEKLSDAYIRGDPGLYAEWDKTAYVLLSGVLDALEKPANDRFKVDVGKFLYPTICGFFFRECSQSAPCPSVELCVTAYSILSEAAHGQKSNQVLLRDRAYLGPERLGIVISTSRDYFIMESLLTLLARLLSTDRVADGESMRAQFVQETLGSSELFKCSKELVRVLREASTSDWDTIATQLLSALAKSDITYPQPFSVKEINACGHLFPQPGASDRLILDRQGFLANVILPMDDVCDSLVVPYGQIQTLNILTPATTVNEVVVMAGLSDPPKVGNTALKVDDGGFYLTFSLGREDLSRFMETLRRRGIGKLTFINSAPRPMKPKKSISLASEVKFASDSSLPAPASDFQEKVKHVKEVYKTVFDDPSSEPVAVSSTPPNSTRNQPQGEPDELRQGKGNPIPKISSTVCSDGGNQVPQANSYSSMTSKSRCSKEDYQSDEENCKTPVLSSPIIDATGLTRPLKHVLSSEDDITAISMSCDVKKSAATKLGDDDTSEAQVTTTQLNEQVSEMIAQPGADTDSGASEVGGHAVGPEVNTDIKVHPAPPSAVASHSPIVRGQSADSGQDVAAGAIEASQPGHLEDTKQLLTPRRNRSSKRQMSNTCIATRPNKRKIQEMTQYGSAADASEVDEEHGTHRKSRKQVHHVPPSNRHTTGSPSISLALVSTTKLDEVNTSHVDGVSNTSSTTSPLVLFEETTTHEFEKPHGQSVDGSLKQDLIPASKGALVEKAKSRPTPKLVSSPKRSDCVVREEITRVATVNSMPSTVAAMGVTATATNDLTTAPQAQSLRSQPFSSELMIPDEPISVHVTNLNDTETNRRWKHGYDKLEALRSEQSAVLDGLSPETSGKLNESILVLGVPPRLSDPKRPHVEEFPSETALARETSPNMDNFVGSTADDFPDLKLTAACLTQPNSVEDANKNKNLDSLRSKGLESVQGYVSKTAEPPTFTTPLSRKRHSVTFASPIETLTHPNVHARAATKPDGGFQSQVESFRQRQPWRQEGRERMDGRIARGEQFKNSYTSKDDAFLPMLVPSKDYNSTREPIVRLPLPTETTVRSTESVSNVFAALEPMTDVVDIQDIVEVLDDIHAVITKCITKRFENVRKDVRTCREEILQEVLQDLEIAAATNASQFNNLVQLEEEYYEYHSSMTRRWEELIQCNADILSHFKDAIRDHDRNVSAKTSPASILPRKPLFSDFKDRMML